MTSATSSDAPPPQRRGDGRHPIVGCLLRGLWLCLPALAAGAAEPLRLDRPETADCPSPVLLRCPVKAPASSEPPAVRAALERERRAQALQELSPIIVYGEQQRKEIQAVFDAFLGPARGPEASTRSYRTADGRRCTQVEGLGYTECTPNANAPPPSGWSSAFPAINR